MKLILLWSLLYLVQEEHFGSDLSHFFFLCLQFWQADRALCIGWARSSPFMAPVFSSLFYDQSRVVCLLTMCERAVRRADIPIGVVGQLECDLTSVFV